MALVSLFLLLIEIYVCMYVVYRHVYYKLWDPQEKTKVISYNSCERMRTIKHSGWLLF